MTDQNPKRNNWRLFVSSLFPTLIALLYLYAAFHPSSKNWGFDHLAFLSLPFRIAIPIIMCLFVLPAVQTSILRLIERTCSYFRELPRLEKILLAFGIVFFAGLFFWVERERIFLLGDGSLIVRIIPNIQRAEDVAHIFKNEPLPGFIYWKVTQLLSVMNIAKGDEFPIQLTNIFFGIGCLLVAIPFIRYLSEDATDRFLLYLFVISSGSIQLFFGYIEVYTPLYFGIILFLWLGIASLRKDIHPVYPSIAFGILFPLHFGVLVLIPAILFVYLQSIRRGKWSQVILSVLALCSTITLLLWLCGYSFDSLYHLVLKGGGHILPFGEVKTTFQAYSLFSFAHLLNLINLQLLISPSALLILFLVLVFRIKKVVTNQEWIFLFITAIFGFTFVVLFNSEIGMSRDWDILATFNLGVVAAAAFSICYLFEDIAIRHRILIMIVGVTMLQSTCYVFVNADEQTALARFITLPDLKLWAKSGMTSTYEELAILYRGRQDAKNSIKYFKEFLEIDSMNSRVWGSLAHVYSLIGDRENELRYDEKAVQTGTKDATIFLNLGTAYIANERYDEGITTLQKAINIDSTLADAYVKLGIVFLQHKHDVLKAYLHFRKAISCNSTLPDAYLGAGECAYRLRDTQSLKIYWKKYLELAPDDTNAYAISKTLKTLK